MNVDQILQILLADKNASKEANQLAVKQELQNDDLFVIFNHITQRLEQIKVENVDLGGSGGGVPEENNVKTFFKIVDLNHASSVPLTTQMADNVNRLPNFTIDGNTLWYFHSRNFLSNNDKEDYFFSFKKGKGNYGQGGTPVTQNDFQLISVVKESELQAIIQVTEGLGIGFRLSNIDPDTVGNIGVGAVDFGTYGGNSQTKGATGARSSNLAGIGNEASGNNSVNLGGERNKASNLGSSNLGGYKNKALGFFSANIGGQDNEAKGLGAVNVGGSNLQTNTFAETAKGQYNLSPEGQENSWTDNDLVESVGGGYSESTRRNIFERWKSGAFKWLNRSLATITNAIKGMHAADLDGRLNYYNGASWSRYAIESETITQADLTNLTNFEYVHKTLYDKAKTYLTDVIANASITGSEDFAIVETDTDFYFASKETNEESFDGSSIKPANLEGQRFELGTPDLTQNGYNFWQLSTASAVNYLQNDGFVYFQLWQKGGGSDVEIIGNLTSTAVEKALSANQGRGLKDLIDNFQGFSGNYEDLTNKPDLSNFLKFVAQSLTVQQQKQARENIDAMAATKEGDIAATGATQEIKLDQNYDSTNVLTDTEDFTIAANPKLGCSHIIRGRFQVRPIINGAVEQQLMSEPSSNFQPTETYTIVVWVEDNQINWIMRKRS